MATTIWTERLRLEPWREVHNEMLVALSAMPEVTRYVGDGQPWSPSRAHEVAAAISEHWLRHSFGWRAAYLRTHGDTAGPAVGRPVGLIAFSLAGAGAGVGPDEYEIGWWLDPSVWGRGLAREGAAAVRDDGFINVGAPDILARIQPANSASMAVATAIGLTFEGSSRGRGGEPISVLRLTADRWRHADLQRPAVPQPVQREAGPGDHPGPASQPLSV
ncbi:MAG: GNAT family N-acetyltransferase [Solirubrobacteraceae bacterium]